VTAKGRWQTCAQVTVGSDQTSLSLLAEQKPLAQRFSERARADEVKRAISALEDALEEPLALVVRERVAKNRRISYGETLYTWTTDATLAELTNGLNAGALLAQADSVGPQYQIAARFWPHARQIRRKQAEAELRAIAAIIETARAALDAETFR
jgi:hypothetical protein